MDTYKELKDETVQWETQGSGVRRVGVVARALALIEYSCVALFFLLALKQKMYMALAMQLFFFSLAAGIDYLVYRKIGSPFDGEPLSTIMMCPVGFLNIPKWLFYWVTLAPNYVHVTSTAITAGSAFNLWAEERFKESKVLFQQHWSYVPLVGSFIGSLGLPWLLTSLLIVSCTIHLLLLLLPLDAFAGEVCDAANLQFLTLAMKAKGWRVTFGPLGDAAVMNFQYARLLSGLLIKYPFLWAKTSLLAVTYDYMDHGMLFSALLSLALAWYGLLQLMPNFFMMVKIVYRDLKEDRWLMIILVLVVLMLSLLILGLVQQAIHLFGVYHCPSHDFSLILLGCSQS